ncbi:hypothetical protein [Rhizobium ruizarguesonis]|uniref:hypothetical protein n=1 Tax=Rhizobium ruizarguesonis TaxID=2081791 RepID=UPI00102F5C09|nr:hypothetical protein [Rhizobium ruizarguesonis]TAT84826.1 hypothetical protein ELI52_15640 [Rhizobium ruizarguesonis]
MKTANKFDSEVKVNTVVWITSLYESQQGVTRRILEDLEPFLRDKHVRFEFHEASSEEGLLAYLEYIRDEAAAGMLPIIHIDTHGNVDEGIHIAATKENVAWATIVEKCRQINVETKNNLCVVSLACFSFSAVREVQITSQTPFYILAAPLTEVTAGFVADVVMPFYRHVFEEHALIGAFRSVLIRKLNLMHCEQVLFTAFVKYVRRFCMGKGAKKRIEDLLSEAKGMGMEIKDYDLSRFRKIIKRSIKPTQALLDRYADSFLMGRPINFELDSVLEHAKKMER